MVGGDRSLNRKQPSASEAGACDQNGKEESASAMTAEILGVKKEGQRRIS
jgi:hypothetical protein